MTPYIWGINANCFNVVKDTDFKFDKHVFRDSTNITPQKFFEKGARPGTHDPLNFGG